MSLCPRFLDHVVKPFADHVVRQLIDTYRLRDTRQISKTGTADACFVSLRLLANDFSEMQDYHGVDMTTFLSIYTDVGDVISHIITNKYIETKVLRRTYLLFHWYKLLLELAAVVCESLFGVENGKQLFRKSLNYLNESGPLPSYSADGF